MSNTRPMFPPAVDSTFLSAFRGCPQHAFRSYVEHWKPQTESVHLVAGGAFAAGIEAARDAFFVQGASHQDSAAAGLKALIDRYGDFECPADSAKSLERTAGALEFYLEMYPLGQDGAIPITLANGRRGIEFSFAEPLDVRHPVSGDPILYTGRSDLIADFAGGIYVFDEKTTSSLGASWSRQWEHRGQFTGYSWACQKIGIKPKGTVVRGVSILKTKYDHMQVVTNRADWEVNRWYDQTCRDVERAVQCWKDGYWDYSLAGACTEYGGCTFTQICKSKDPELWLPMSFTKRVWDPLAREEITLDQWHAMFPQCIEA